MNFVNLTPHAIVINNGTTFEPSGNVARVSASFEKTGEVYGIPTFKQVFGEVENIPEPTQDTIYIVSGMVLGAIKNRNDVFAPSTGQGDTLRNDKGHIISVEGLTQ